MTVAAFPPASLSAQVAELKREHADRLARRDAMDLSSKRATATEVDHRNNALVGAIATLDRILEAQQRGEPTRSAMIEVLRDALNHLPLPSSMSGGELRARIADMLARLPA